MILAPEERASRIEGQLRAAASGGTWDDHGLREEWRDLVEYPTVVIGEVPAEFRSLPPEVLETVLVHHQKSISLRDDTRPHRAVRRHHERRRRRRGEIVRGMERVVVARLRDAAFFLAEDRKSALGDRVPDLGRGDVPPGARQLPRQVGADGEAGRGHGRPGPPRRGRPGGGEAGGAAREGRPRHVHGARVPRAAGRDGRDLPRGGGGAGRGGLRRALALPARSRSSPMRSPRGPSPAPTGSRASSPPSPSPTSSTPWPGTSAWARARPAAATPTACAAPARARCAPCSTSGGRSRARRAPDLQALLAAAVDGLRGAEAAGRQGSRRRGGLPPRPAGVRAGGPGLLSRRVSGRHRRALQRSPAPPGGRDVIRALADPIDAWRRAEALQRVRREVPRGLRRPGRGLQARQEHPRAGTLRRRPSIRRSSRRTPSARSSTPPRPSRRPRAPTRTACGASPLSAPPSGASSTTCSSWPRTRGCAPTGSLSSI